jgi:hypothetical protein
VPDVLTAGFCKADEKLFGPIQLYETPEVDELPVSDKEFVVQVSVPPAAVAPGPVIFCATVTVLVELQPFEGSVTVSV